MFFSSPFFLFIAETRIVYLSAVVDFLFLACGCSSYSLILRIRSYRWECDWRSFFSSLTFTSAHQLFISNSSGFSSLTFILCCFFFSFSRCCSSFDGVVDGCCFLMCSHRLGCLNFKHKLNLNCVCAIFFRAHVTLDLFVNRFMSDNEKKTCQRFLFFATDDGKNIPSAICIRFSLQRKIFPFFLESFSRKNIHR